MSTIPEAPGSVDTILLGAPSKTRTTPSVIDVRSQSAEAGSGEPRPAERAQRSTQNIDRRIPTGVVTFLFSDIEGSTSLWARFPDSMSEALRLHDDVMRSVLGKHGGYVFSTAGDSFGAAFQLPDAAVQAAIEITDQLGGMAWPEQVKLRVRIGIHVGVAEERDGNYFGQSVNLAARVEQAARGGQILASDALAAVVKDTARRPLGLHQLRGFDQPVPLWQIDRPGQESVALPLRKDTVRGGSLPTQPVSILGRDHALVEVRKVVADHRLVTLTGPGGIGKTTLAIEVAGRESLSGYRDVYFVDLNAIKPGDNAAVPFFRVLGVETEHGEEAHGRLALAIGDRAVLLVVDNCEHVLDEIAPLLMELGSCPNARILCTSREAFGLPGERVWRVPSLEPRPTGIELFLDRAREIDASFELSAVDETIVEQICEELDGVPLAIELAAARVRTISVNDILVGLNHRFRLLSGRRRGATEKSRTLESVIAWSYDLLAPEEQRVLRFLSIFDESFDLADVMGLTGLSDFAAIDMLDALLAKSLVESFRVKNDATTSPVVPSSAGVRYRMLVSLRSFARARLEEAGEEQFARDLHLEHVLATTAAPDELDLIGAASRNHIRDFDFPSLRAAANWALARDRPEDAARLALGRGIAIADLGAAEEGLRWLAGRDALSIPNQLWALNGCAYLATSLGDTVLARTFSEEAFRLADGRSYDSMPNAYGFAAINLVNEDNDEALRLVERSIEAALAAPSKELHIASVHQMLAWVHLFGRRWEAALEACALGHATKTAVGTGPLALLRLEIIALSALQRHDELRRLLASVPADARHHRGMQHLSLLDPNLDLDSVLLDAARGAVGLHGGPTAQRCAELLAVVSWRRHLSGTGDVAGLASAAAVGSTPFGALALEALGRSQGWTETEWRREQARVGANANTAQGRAHAVRLVWELIEGSPPSA